MPNSQRFMQSSRGPRGRWPGGLQRGNGQYPQRGLPAAQTFSFPQAPQEEQMEDADEEVDVKIEPMEDVGVHGAPSSALSVAGSSGLASRGGVSPTTMRTAQINNSSLVSHDDQGPSSHDLAVSTASSHVYHLNQIPLSERASLYRATVRLVVGPSATPFIIHTGLLYHFSAYFRSVLRYATTARKMRNSDPDEYSLPHDSSIIVEYFNSWLYTGQPFDTPVSSITWTLLVDIYTWGAARGTPLFQDQVMEAMIEKFTANGAMPMGVVAKIYTSTTTFVVGDHGREVIVNVEVPMLKKLAIDYYAIMDKTGFQRATGGNSVANATGNAVGGSSSSGVRGANDVPAEFWRDLCMELKMNPDSSRAQIQNCRFHLHAVNKQCWLAGREG